MEKPPSQEAAQRLTPAQSVWETLTENQKAAVLRAILQVCQELVTHGPNEVPHDPACVSA